MRPKITTPSIAASKIAAALLPIVALTPMSFAQGDTGAAETEPLSLEELQRQIDELQARFSKTPINGSSRASMKIFGRIHTDFWAFSESDDAINVFESGDPNVDPQNNIEFRRARLGVSGKIHESMRYKIELDFGKPDELTFKDMFFGFDDLPGGQHVQIGNQKRPYGLDHLNSSRYNVFIERPFVIEAFNQDARRLGVTAYGLSENKAWNWRYGVYNMRDWSKSGEYVGDTIQPELTGRLANTALWENDGSKYAHWAVSGSLAFPNGDPVNGDASNEGRFRTRPEGRSQSRWIDTGRIGGADNYQLIGLEGVWNDGPTQIVAEFQNTWLSRDTGSDLQCYGGYIQAAHFLTGEHMPWDRKSGQLGRPKPKTLLAPGHGWGGWQVAARYSMADFSNKDVRGGRGESITLGVNWYWNPNASVQFNYIRGEISERSEDVGGSLFSGGDYDIFGMRLRVDF